MFLHATKRILAVAAFASTVLPADSSLAAPSTSRGLISIAQVTEMLEKAATDRTAQQVLTAYLGGVGEAAGAVVNMRGVTCRAALSLSAANVGQALRGAATKK